MNLDKRIFALDRKEQELDESQIKQISLLENISGFTKKQAKDIVQQEADRCGMFYIVERWLGGSLTNFTTIKKSIKRL